MDSFIFFCARVLSMSFMKAISSIIFFMIIAFTVALPVSAGNNTTVMNQSPNYSGVQTISPSQISMNLTFNETGQKARQPDAISTNQSLPSFQSSANNAPKTAPKNQFSVSGDLSNSDGTTLSGEAPVTFIIDPVTKREYITDQVIVRYNTKKFQNPEIMKARILDSNAKIGARVAEDFSDSGLPAMQVVKLPRNISVNDAITEYRKNPDVLYAQPNYVYHTTSVTPDDPLFGSQWGLHNAITPGADIDAPDAWSISTGSNTVIVAVIDTGVDYNHPDLSSNIWTNPGESGLDSQGHDKRFNGIDDDNNGYIDDWHGWNFFNNTSDPMDGNTKLNAYHGTHVSGILGGVGNNSVGIAGVNWNVKIMPLRTTDETGSSYTSTNVEAIYYASANGATIISNSWGGDSPDPEVKYAIENSPAVVVCAAGNNNRDTDYNPYYPASFDSINIISVAATDSSDIKALSSNFGLASVDLAAPGIHIYSTMKDSGYQYKDGTSMATSFVSGVAALIKSTNPRLTNIQIKNIILNNVDVIPALSGKVNSSGRLNAYKAVKAAQLSLGIPVADFTGSPRTGVGPLTIEFTDLSTNATGWNWTFGDGSDENATIQNPVHTYLNNGTYTVILNVSNSLGSNSLTKTNFIIIGSISKIGVFRGQGYWYLDMNNNGTWDGTLTDRTFIWGKQPGDIPITGDWNKDNITETGIFRPGGDWYLDMNNNGTWDSIPTDRTFTWGKQPGDIPLTGDWNGDRITETGIFRPGGNWYLDMNNNGTWDGTPTDTTFSWGKQPEDIPLTGDWNGDGITETGIFRLGGNWYLDKNNNGTWDGTPPDTTFSWGKQPGDIPVTGDWNGDMITETGIFRPTVGFYLDLNNNGQWDGPLTDKFMPWGSQTGDDPVIGRW
jgi:thermitase